MTYLGWLYRWGTPITLIGDDTDQIANARRELVRIGIDDVAGSATADLQRWNNGSGGVSSYRVADFAALATLDDRNAVRVLDVRREDEFTTAHVVGAVNIPVHELLERVAELDEADIWVHCASGYRASVAASLIDTIGKSVVLVDDTFERAMDLGLTT